MVLNCKVLLEEAERQDFYPRKGVGKGAAVLAVMDVVPESSRRDFGLEFARREYQ